MNTIFNENTYFDYFKNFNAALNRAAKADAIIKHLKFRGIPEGSVIFSSPKRRHILASGEEKEYVYTNAYLYIDGKKYYISKKFPYPKKNDGQDLNDYTNPANHLFLLARFWMRMSAKEILKVSLACAKTLAKLLNSIKSRELPRIKFEDYMNDYFNDFWQSEDNQLLANSIDDFLDMPADKQLRALDLRPTVESADAANFAEQIIEMAQTNSNNRKPNLQVANYIDRQYKNKKHVWYKIRDNIRLRKRKQKLDFGSEDIGNAELQEKAKNDLKHTFNCSIINDCGEQLRSKNEVIATRCAHDCGLCYELEPYYPGSFWRADLLLSVNGRKVFVEIAGSRDKPDYEKHLKEKIAFAQENGLCLVVIDMTAYPDDTGKTFMHMNYSIICRIFLYIRLGMLKRGIVWPY